MKDHCRTTFFILMISTSVLVNLTTAFKIPGLSGSSRPQVAQKVGTHNQIANYKGPVFIIKEQDKEKGEYDAFITNGGIQEVRGSIGQQPIQQPIAVNNGQPSVKEEEDIEYFAVLVTPDTVAQLQFPKTTEIKIPISVLLVAVSSKLPWLLVLRRKNYPQFFEYQLTTPNPNIGLLGYPPQQVPPMRRRYYDRQRRGLFSADPIRPNEDEDAMEMIRLMPLIFEGEMLSTICYNFIQDYVTTGKMPKVPITAKPADLNEQRSAGTYNVVTESAPTQMLSSDLLPVPMSIPKRVA
ncbi:uncharacterized protein LOC126894926 isoform X1 [Daktulosphaira vitifoliae]|uniref:uncharacterized protein LOC126894926 isoform X1 n=1 Tax=Daktulosphaira vitifoliae TaxID=58002 RepID=UPI0021AA3141|nr:uncharacterized protein LOC126894926 isoform X1 [Daktulosphaira vitifoliae]